MRVPAERRLAVFVQHLLPAQEVLPARVPQQTGCLRDVGPRQASAFSEPQVERGR